MVVNPHQLGQDRPDVFAARRKLDPHELLHHVVPGDFIGKWGNVVHPVDDGDVLVVVEILTELLETAVQEADVRNDLDDRLAVEGQDQAQSGVRGRMLRSEIQCPEVFLLRPVGGNRRFGQLQRHLHLATF